MAKKIITENTNLTREELEILAKVPNDVFLFSLFCYVIHPVRGKVRFELYPYQKSVLYQFVKERFNILLKFRQAGITELISMYCLWLAMYHPNKKINIISIKDTTAKKVLKKIKFMYKNLPWYLQTPIINGRAGEFGSASMIEFDNGSFIESIPTSSEAGRSESLSLLVIDEAAIVRWAAQIWAAAFPTLSCSVGSTPVFLRHYEEIKKGYPKPITEQIKLRTLCPKQKGVLDISNLGYYTLTHTGSWKKILWTQNKGKLETWFVKDNRGKKAGYTPKHRLFTTKGWKTVEEIIDQNLNIIQADTKVDHINNQRDCNHINNLRYISSSDNVKKSFEYNLNATIFGIQGDKLPNLLKRGRILEMAEEGFSYREIAREVYPEYKQAHKFVKRILTERGSRVYISKLQVVKKCQRTIYDIHVEDDNSYISANNYINHNTGGAAIVNSTPYGVGNFYHSTWVDAIAGGNPFNPIRLYWQMHPERDENWYKQMASALGPKRTAQEIDGDFLSSGNTVFDLADIKAIEDCLSDYPVIKKRFNGQYRQYLEPQSDKEYFIGADVSTGRASDYSAFTCMDKQGEEQAVFKGRIPIDKYAKLLGDTGQLYNWATIAPESNDVGMAVTTKLQDEGYPKLYYYQKMLKKKGKSRPEVDKSPGWLTTQKNRSVIIENLEQDIREEYVIIKDPFFVQEAYTFIYDGLGRPVAMGKHRANNSAVDIDLEGDVYSDDSIFGKAICNHIRKGKTNIIVQPK